MYKDVVFAQGAPRQHFCNLRPTESITSVSKN